MTGLQSSREIFITCAVTGAGDTIGRSDKIPITPQEIADSCIASAKAGAAIVHIHVRDPKTGAAARHPDLYEEVMNIIRESKVDMVLNFTAGMGGDMVFGSAEKPLPLNDEGTDMAGATERLAHVRNLLPEICTIDCGTMNFGEGDYVMTNTPAILREMSKQVQALGVRPEIECFDTGHLQLAMWLKENGWIDDPVMIQLCMGIPWGAPDDLHTMMAMISNVPDDWTFSAFSIGRNQLPYVAMAILAGGNVRVGLEDNIYLKKGVLATNEDLVERAVIIAEGMGVKVLGPEEVRERMQLQKRWG
ncbi:MAG: 3-keto-5-aminohexanoate cleavage protein [Gammaproteobacteria bacterium]